MTSSFLLLFHALLLSLNAAGSILAFNSNNTLEIKCIESERQALLNFKLSLFDYYGLLSTWTDDDYNTDCCKWKGIQCNYQTGHVQLLHLRGQDTSYLSGVINLTSLIVLQHIQHLDLSNNDFRESHIPTLIGSFTNLTYLNLSYSEFEGSIPCELGYLTRLQYLDLSRNYNLDGELPYQLGNLSQLRHLDLSENSFSGALPYNLGNLSQLRHLDLGGNSFSGPLPFQVGDLSMLHTLRGGNFDVNSKDAEWFSNLYALKNLALSSFHNLGSSYHWLQMMSRLIPNLKELRLVDCSLLDTHVHFLFHSSSNHSTSLTILDLSSNMLTSSTFQLLFNFSLNLQELYLSQNNIVLSPPLYLSFPSLTILDLSYNNLTSLVFKGSFNFSSKLQNLNLQNCGLMDRSFLMSSSSLISLDLSSNMLRSSTIFHWLFNSTTNLRTLNLDGNLLEGPIPGGFGKVMNSLEILYLSRNKLQGEIPSFFGNMCSLQRLYLSSNKLSGDISSFFQNSSWCNRPVFKSLDLSDNRITGMLPKSIGLLSQLEHLYLAGNSLEGEVTEFHFFNFSKLEYLSLSGNSLSLIFVPSWSPPFQLKHLKLRSCKLGPTFPSWLQTQSFLSIVDISDSGLNDSVPEWFWNNLQKISMLNMSHNNLIGVIPNLSLKLLFKPSIILNANQFVGKVPSFLLQASELSLSQNKFSDLFSFLCDKSKTANTVELDLSNNEIKGQLPDCWKTLEGLASLNFTNNKLSGKIPLSVGTLINLKSLVLRNNSLMGELPSTLKNCRNLIMLDVSENMLSGPIPSWIGESMPQMIVLKMSGNYFSRNLPSSICYLKRIQLLDLSRNNLSKRIPSCIKNFTAMSEKSINTSEIRSRIYQFINTYHFYYISLDIRWMWKGVERPFFDPEFIFKGIDLSCNNLTGDIPKEVGYLLGLVSLNLSRNHLSGEIPSEIGNLRSLDSLDLSVNHLGGQIPSSLTEIDGLSNIDLSNNSLSGRIPSGRHFETFEASSFGGNAGLCGQQLNKTCPGDGDQTTAKPHEEATVDGEDSGFYEALHMSLGVGFFTGFWSLVGSILLWKPWRIVYISFLNRFTDYMYVMVAVNKAKWLKH